MPIHLEGSAQVLAGHSSATTALQQLWHTVDPVVDIDERRYSRWALANFGADLTLIILAICLFLLIVATSMGVALTGYLVMIALIGGFGAFRIVTVLYRDKLYDPSFRDRDERELPYSRAPSDAGRTP